MPFHVYKYPKNHSMLMKILVIGGSGMIGSKVVDHFLKTNNEVEFTYFTHDVPFRTGYHLDITQKDDTVKLITKINPDIVIHSSALVNVDLCETNNSLADSINVNGTANIIEGCKVVKDKLIYISTSFVFDGSKQKYVEDDIPSPSTYYGLTKYGGEELVRNSDLTYLILRTDQPYCWVEKWQRTNSVLRVLQTLRSGKVLKEITDWYNAPTYVPDLVHAIEKLLEDNAEGIFHLVGSEFINRYNWALKVANTFGLDKNLIKPITSDALSLPAKRVSVNLCNKKLFQKTGLRMYNIQDGLNDMKRIENVA